MPVSHIGLTVSHLPTSCSFFLAALQPLGYKYIGQQGNQIGRRPGIRMNLPSSDLSNPPLIITFILILILILMPPNRQLSNKHSTPTISIHLSVHVHVTKRAGCSVKAGPTHIAFSAPSRSTVHAFFTSALKAGGRIHGEPALRHVESGYYNAAVLDMDGNSVEVVCRDAVKGGGNVNRKDRGGVEEEEEEEEEGSRVLGWRDDVARSCFLEEGEGEERGRRRGVVSGGGGEGGGRTVVVNNRITPTVLVSSPPAEPAQTTSDVSAKAIIGTLLGAAAGAAVAYAMTKGESASQGQSQAQSQPIVQTIYRAIEGVQVERPYQASVESRAPTTVPQESEYGDDRQTPRSTTSYHSKRPDAPRSSTSSTRPRSALRAIEAPPPQPAQAPSSRSTLINTFIPPSEVPRLPLQRPGPVTAKSETHISTHSAAKSHYSSSVKPPTVIRAASTYSVAKDIPLPQSSRASNVSAAAHDGPEVARSLVGSILGLDLGCESVAPSDSVSQAGSKRSRHSKTSRTGSRHSSRPPMHSRHNSSRSSGSKVETDEVVRPGEPGSRVSGASQRTVRPSKAEGASKRGSVMSVPQGRAGSKASGVRERSVVSMVLGK
ncbi:MAG: hypothetical protein M1830_007192 [Pleopsidium flavum]|nr:MAG: hypothetical protein M1830_007192 [Pleopsidium flavum]